MNFLLPLSLLLLAQPENSVEQQLVASETTLESTETAAEAPEKPESSLTEPTQPKKRVPLLGVRLDLGFPDGLGLDFLGNPLPFLQLHLGLMYSIFGVGFRGGVSFLPWHGVFRPVLTLESGYQFNSMVGLWLYTTHVSLYNLFDNFRYTFINSTLGFDVGSANVAFIFRIGGSFLFFNNNHFSYPIKNGDDAEMVSIRKVRSTGFIPTARIGISICFL